MHTLKYFFDTEFAEDGKTIELISIGIVAEDSREYYACNAELNLAKCSTWVRENVLPQLPSFASTHQNVIDNPDVSVWKTRAQIAEDIKQFVLEHADKEKPEFYAYFADYDWVVLCQLFGTMVNLPGGFPMYCRDIKQIMYHLQVDKEALPKQVGAHDALCDARWNRDAFKLLAEIAGSGRVNPIKP